MSGLEIPLLISAVAGTGLQAGGMIAGANAQSDAAKQNAAIKNAQADELLQRQAINEDIMREQSSRQQSQYVTDFASTGGEGAGIGGVLLMKRDLEQSIINSRRDAEFKANMLRAGANMDLNLASDAATSGWISGAGTVLTGATKVYDMYRPASSNAPSLPTVKG